MEINKARFFSIVYDSTLENHERYNIGTYKEKKLHIMMKKYFEGDPQYHEIPTNGFIADILRDGVITEIETSGFSGLKPKLAAYLPEYKVNLVYPAAARKFVLWIDPETSEISSRRQSPKKTDVYDAIFEMVRILPYAADPNLTVLIPLLEIDEYRLLNGWSRDRKKGSERYERVPIDLFDIAELSSDCDFVKYIPENCVKDFTVKEFTKAVKKPENKVRGILRVYEARGLIEKTGKKGNSILYSRV